MLGLWSGVVLGLWSGVVLGLWSGAAARLWWSGLVLGLWSGGGGSVVVGVGGSVVVVGAWVVVGGAAVVVVVAETVGAWVVVGGAWVVVVVAETVGAAVVVGGAWVVVGEAEAVGAAVVAVGVLSVGAWGGGGLCGCCGRRRVGVLGARGAQQRHCGRRSGQDASSARCQCCHVGSPTVGTRHSKPVTLTGLPRAGSPVLPRRILLGEVGLWVPRVQLGVSVLWSAAVASVTFGHAVVVFHPLLGQLAR